MSRFPPYSACLLLASGILVGFSGTSRAQERFLLEVPGRNDLTSSATITNNQLVITDAQNQTFVYQRSPRLDTPDGRYLGFYSRAAGQTLRWPANDAGSMLIGDATGQNWRRSQQQIQVQRAVPFPRRVPQQNFPQQPNTITTRRPNYNSPLVDTPPLINRDINTRNQQRQARQQNLPMEVAYTRAGDQALDVGYIGPKGDLQLYRGWRDKWQPHQFSNAANLQSVGLIPGAPLQLVSRQGQNVPSAYTVNSGGQLVEVGYNGQIRQVANNVQFAPRSHFQVQPAGNGVNGFAVDAQGRLWDLDLATGRNQLIDQNARFTAGVPISVVSHRADRGLQDEIFLVDRNGQIVNYSSAGSYWNGPQTVAAGFPPGAPITATLQQFGGRNQVRVAAVDALGRVQTLAQTHAGWQTYPVQNAVLPPGSPLAFTGLGADFGLAGIGAGGIWNEWNYAQQGWDQSVITRGFLAGSPVAADPYSQTVFGVDATGRLIAGGYWDNAWHPYLLRPDLDYAPPLVQRNIVGNRALPPATVYFDNPSQEELVVQMVDQFNPRPAVQFNIPPGGSVPKATPRDGGGVLQETYLTPGPFGDWVEQVETYPLPPQPGPTMVVWAKRTTYTYIDPKNISVVPDFDLKNNVSLGVFELPPGEFLENGDRFNVYLEAAARRNPGGAHYFGMPIPDADVGVPIYRNYETNLRTNPPETTLPRATPNLRVPQNTVPRSRVPQNTPPREPAPEQPADSQDEPVIPPLPE